MGHRRLGGGAARGRFLLAGGLPGAAVLLAWLALAPAAQAQEWSAPQELAYGLADVSCAPEGTLCVAVDNQLYNGLTAMENPYDGYAFVFKGGTWTGTLAGEAGVGLEAVSCLSASACVAVDEKGRALIYNGTAWSAPSAQFDSEGVPAGISCPSSAYCIAIDNQGYAFRLEKGKAGGKKLLDKNGLISVSCASASFCVAVGAPETSVNPYGGHDRAYTYNGAEWSSPTTLEDETGVQDVSCASSMFCLAVEGDSTLGFGDVIEYDGSGWLAPQPISTETLVGVSCPTSTFCTVLDNQGGAYIFDGTGWSGPVQAIPQRGGSIYVSCTASGLCAAAGQMDAATAGFVAPPSGGVCPGALGPGCVAPAARQDPTSTSVSCVLATAQGADTCTALVTDTAAAGATPPTGQVTFSALVAGNFPGGPMCSLIARSASASSCSVTFVPPSTDYKDTDELAGLAGELGRVGNGLRAAAEALERREKESGKARRATSSSTRSRLRELEDAVFEIYEDAHGAQEDVEDITVTISTGGSEKLHEQVPADATALGRIFAQAAHTVAGLRGETQFREALAAAQLQALALLTALDGAEAANMQATYGGDASHAPSSTEAPFPSADELASGAEVAGSATAQKDHAVLSVSCEFACTIAAVLEESSQAGGVAKGSAASQLARLGRPKATRPRVILGRGRISLAAGAHGKLVISLSSRGRKAADTARSLHARLSLTIETARGLIVSETSRPLVVRSARRHR